MDGISPFTPQRVIQPQQRQKTNPWSTVLPSLTQAVVMGMVKNKLDKNLQKQQYEQTMIGKGFVWDEASKTWIPPGIDQVPIGTGNDKLVSQAGEFKTIYQDTASNDERDRRKALDLVLAQAAARREENVQQYGFDLDKLKVGSSLRADEERQQNKERLSARMQELGGVWDAEQNRYTFPTDIKTDKDSGAIILQRGANAQVIPNSKVDKGVDWTVTNDNGELVPRPWKVGESEGIFNSSGSAIQTNKKGKQDKDWDFKTFAEATEAIDATIDKLSLPDPTAAAAKAHLTFYQNFRKDKATLRSAYDAAIDAVTPKNAESAGGMLPVGSKWKDGKRVVAAIGNEKGTGRLTYQFTDGTTAYGDQP